MRKHQACSPPVNPSGERPSSKTPLPESQRTTLLGLVMNDGENETAKALGVNRYSLLKACAGLPLSASVLCLVQTRLSERGAL